LDVEILGLKKGESVRIWLRMDERRLTESTCGDPLIQTEAQAKIPLNHETRKDESTKKTSFKFKPLIPISILFVFSFFRTTVRLISSFPAKNCWRLLWKSSAVQHLITKERKNEKGEWINGHAGLLMNLNAPTLFFSPVGL